MTTTRLRALGAAVLATAALAALGGCSSATPQASAPTSRATSAGSFSTFTSITLTGAGSGTLAAEQALAAADKAGLSPVRALVEDGSVVLQVGAGVGEQQLSALTGALPDAQVASVEGWSQMGTAALPDEGVVVSAPCHLATANLATMGDGPVLLLSAKEDRIEAVYAAGTDTQAAVQDLATLCSAPVPDVSVASYTLVPSS